MKDLKNIEVNYEEVKPFPQDFWNHGYNPISGHKIFYVYNEEGEVQSGQEI